MKNVLRINHKNGMLIMDRTFAKLAENTRSAEYAHLQQVRRDYPEYSVALRKIEKNTNKETYTGLTYDYMIKYIISHEPDEDVANVLNEFNELKLISECHAKAKRYPTIKKWFLEKYPEIVKFGMPPKEEKIEEKKNIIEFKMQKLIS